MSATPPGELTSPQYAPKGLQIFKPHRQNYSSKGTQGSVWLPVPFVPAPLLNRTKRKPLRCTADPGGWGREGHNMKTTCPKDLVLQG